MRFRILRREKGAPRRPAPVRPLRPVPLSWKTPMGDTMERREAGKI